MDAVFFHARIFDNEVYTRGSASCTLGTPVAIAGKPEEEGIFARWQWDGEQLIARNDRYGFYPIYYFQRPGEICISPSIPKLIEEGAPTELDYQALSVFFRIGNFIGEDTPFEHIRTFPPKAIITWSKEGFQLSSEGMPPPRQGPRSLDDAIDGYVEYFKRAIENHIPPSENFAMPLSGGMDSRHILLGLCDMGHKPKFCITSRYFPHMIASDPDIAARVTETLGLKHIIVEPLESEFEAVVWRNEITNFCASEHHWMKTMTDYLVREVDTVYDGLGGDVLSAIEDELRIEKERYEFFSGGKFEELADLLLIKNGLKKLFIPEVFDKLNRDIAVRHLGNELEKYADYPDPSNVSWFWTRTRRMIALAPYSVLAGVPNVFSPFLDHDLCDFLLSLPRDLKYGTDIHGKAIRRAYPACEHIPFTVRADTDYPEYRTNKKLIREFAKFFIKRKPEKKLRYQYILPRLAAYAFTGKYGSAQSGFITLLTYLYQLDEAAEGKKENLQWAHAGTGGRTKPPTVEITGDRHATDVDRTIEREIQTDAAFFHARVIDGAVKTHGSVSCTLGTPITISGKSEEEGIFAKWEWDGEQLVARNDRYGFYPVFYFQRPGEICVSPSIFKLIEEGAPTELDYRGLSVYFRIGHFIGEDTPFEHIRAFPPGARLRWSRSGFELSSERVPPPMAARISFDDAVDGFIEYFKGAIEHQRPTSDNFAVPLSGGRDSRHILMELCKTGYKPRFCITSKYFPPMETKDSDVAARVAGALGVPHKIIKPLGSEFDAMVRKNIITNLCAPEHHWMMTLADYLDNEVETIYDGIGGDTIGALEDELQVEEQWYDMFTTGQVDKLADMILIKNGLRKLFVPEVYKKLGRGIAIEHLSGELEKYADYPEPSNSYWFWTRTRRMVALAPYCVLRPVTNVLSPYLDHELYDFLVTIPRELKFRTDLHGVAVKRAYPEYADLEFVNREDSNFPDYGTTRQLIRDFTKFFITKKPKKRLRYQYILPRLLANIFTKKYTAVQSGFIPVVTYLYQLEEAASRKIVNLEWDR